MEFGDVEKQSVISDIMLICKKQDESQKALIKEIIEYNAFGGKMTRASLTFLTCMEVKPKMERQLAMKLSFVNELLQGSFLIFDDIMDNAEYRRGKKCWHIKKGMLSLKDAYMLFSLSKKYLKHLKPTIGLAFFAELVFKTVLGQAMDSLIPSPSLSIGFKQKYTMQNYKIICYNKNAYYTFYFPIKLCISFCEVREAPMLREFSERCGYLHQMQDDYLNFFPEKSRKTSSDFQEKKATWFLCQIVEKSSRDDKNIIHYFETKEEEEMLKKVKELYSLFFEEEEKILKELKHKTANSSQEIYKMCIKVLEKRRKCETASLH